VCYFFLFSHWQRRLNDTVVLFSFEGSQHKWSAVGAKAVSDPKLTNEQLSKEDTTETQCAANPDAVRLIRLAEKHGKVGCLHGAVCIRALQADFQAVFSALSASHYCCFDLDECGVAGTFADGDASFVFVDCEAEGG
jgi:hypothetical protein